MGNSINNKEVWKPVDDYRGLYEVSNLGRVKSLPTESGGMRGKRGRKGQLLKGGLGGRGYLHVTLRKAGIKKTVNIHCLVIKAFLPKKYKELEANHKNGIKTDNRLENLEWVTKSENQHHALKMGLKKILKGDACSWVKLNEMQIHVIKHLFKINPLLTCRQIARFFNVSSSLIQQIKCGKIWKQCGDRFLRQNSHLFQLRQASKKNDERLARSGC